MNAPRTHRISLSPALLLSLLLPAGCRAARADFSPPPAAEAGAAPSTAVLEVLPVVSRPLATTVHLQGELEPDQAVAIYPRVSGFVESIAIDRGSRVRRGQVLARLVAPELAAQRNEAEAKMRGDLSTLERLRAAAQTPGVVAGNEVERADATVEAGRARVRSLGQLENYLTVTAPFDGIVTERNVHPGALVGPSTAPNAVPMVRIEQVARLRLTASVPEDAAGELAEGASASFTVRAWPQRVFTGTIRRPSHVVDVRTRTMAVELDVDNSDDRLAPGMYADIAWPVRRSEATLFVPPSAIIQTTEQTFVVRVRDGVVDRVAVRRGVAAEDLVEVFGQLASDDLVARRGSEELRTGTRVETRVLVGANSASR